MRSLKSTADARGRFVKSVIFGTATGLSLICSNWSALASFSGDSTGTFIDPVPATGVTVSGVGTSLFTWGDPAGFGTGPNSLHYVNTPFSSVPAETAFKVGTLTYFNGTTAVGSTPTSINLNLAVNFADPLGVNQGFLYTMQLISTPNSGTAEENADYVILSTFPDARFTAGGTSYTLTLGFTDLQGGGFIQTGNELHVLEGQTATADLTGTITTAAVPEPSTMVAGGLLLLPFGASAWRILRKNRTA